MKIAVLSDIHDHIDPLNKALDIIKAKKCDAVIFCGDLISGFTTGILAKANLPTYACLGNNDEDHIAMMKLGGKNFEWFQLSQEYGQVELGGRKIAFCHYKKLASLMAETDEYNAVFYGHTHIIENKKVGKTLLLNPGAVCGINFQKATYDRSTFAIYDTKTNSAVIVDIDSGLSEKEEEEKQIAKEKAIYLALRQDMALTRRGLEVHGIRADGSAKLISKSDKHKTLWHDALKALSKK
jgi:uncharacterized protein